MSNINYRKYPYGVILDEETAMDNMIEVKLMEELADGGWIFNSKKKRAKDKNIPVEVNTIEELVAPVVIEETEEELVEVHNIEELVDRGPVIDEEEDEVFAPKSKCTDIELAVRVLEGSNKELTAEDFDEQVWLEANELYYSDDDYREEIDIGGGTVLIMSPDRLADFMEDRFRTIQSWTEDEEDIGETNESNEYIYEDDEVNVPEECDVTIMSFAKGFWCMGLEAA